MTNTKLSRDREPNVHSDENAGLTVAGWGASPHWGVKATLLLSSAALLMLEVSLTRFFSYTIWYHFAYLTISVALLGFGSSGAIVAAFPRFISRHGQRFLVATLVLAAAATMAGLAFLAQHPIEVQNLMNKPLHFSVSLMAYYVIVGAPFLLAGFSVSVPFAAYPSMMGRLYFWDLVGAALGCGSIAVLIELLGVPGLIFASAGLMVLSAATLLLGSGDRRGGGVLVAAAAGVLLVAVPLAQRLPVEITASKNLTDLRQADEEHNDGPRTDSFYKWTAINRVDAFGWDRPTPYSFWSGIGLSQTWTGSKPPVSRLTYDGSNGSDVYASKGDIQNEFRMMEHHMLRLPYLVLDRPNVLAIGVGGGIDLFNAIKQGARHVTGAELQPVTVDLLKNRLREYNGGFYHRDDVTLVASEGRHFVRKADQAYNLIQITAVDTFAAQAAGAYVLAESYLYTVEAMRDYMGHLADDGLVTIVIGDIPVQGEFPPLGTRAAMIGFRALEEQGVANPGQHIVVVSSSGTNALALDQSILVKKTPFTPEQVGRIRAFADENGFNMLYAPGPGIYQLAPVLGPDDAVRAKAIEDSWFNVEATRDGDPFFYNVGKWRNMSPAKGMMFIMPGSFMGQLVLILMVVQSTLLGAILVVFPLLRGAREGLKVPYVGYYLAYFLSLGIGFMFIEISFVQSFVLFLGSPTYALSVTIFALLLFSGIGSLVSSRFAANPEAALRRLAPLIAVLVIGYSFGLSRVFDAALHLDIAPRIFIAVLAQMPIGLTLGMFMPLGIACLAREHARLVPWAWGVNGVGSVAGTTLAVLLAMATGFRTVAMVAAALYLLGTALLLRARRQTAPSA